MLIIAYPLPFLLVYDCLCRMLHLGCPVVYGNKWIANKWVRWKEQMNRYRYKMLIVK